MRRLLALVIVVAAIGVAAFLADRPGQVEIVWQGWRIDTSVAVLAASMALAVLVVAALFLLAAALGRMPRNLRRRRAARRREIGEKIMTRGLVALAAGDASEARRHATRAAALLDGAPIPLLLAAEAAARQGDVTAARRSYMALLDRPETEFLGLRGLLGQALRGGDDDAARHLAERGRLIYPDAGWLVDNLLVLQARAGDWAAARTMLAGAARRQVLPAARARHHRGIVLHELSRAAERRGELRRATGLAARAQALASDLAEPACNHARLLIALGRQRAAAKAIERAWRTAPHPDLARLYLDIHPEAAPLARASSLERLARQNPEASESHLAIAEAALAARLWGEARRHLELAAAAAAIPGAARGPSRGLCLLMARLEDSEPGDPAAARDWRERAIGAPADPAYVCRQCGGDSSAWQALCPECGGFDTLAWRSRPSAQKSISGAIIARPEDADAALMLPAPGEAGVSAAVPSGLAPPPRWDK